MKDVLLAITSIASSLFIVLFVIVLGWYIVWKLFLSRFRFVQELLGSLNGNASDKPETRDGRSRNKRTRRDQ